jgi:peptidoglycan hydrolase-like protein with peptidoglycan-binding domain
MLQIKRGDSGRPVRVLQYLLNLPPTGIFDEKLDKVLRAFQAARKLKVDGICGPITWAELARVQKIKQRVRTFLVIDPVVKAIQDILAIKVDGKFGEETEKAVMQAQGEGALTKSGVVTTATWTYLLTKYELVHTPNVQPIKPIDYKQYDPRWGGKMYSSHGDKNQTIRGSGCGPTAMANILATWFNRAITPVEVCAMAVKNKFRTYASGTSRAFFDWIAKQYAFTGYRRTFNADEVLTALENGAYVVGLFGPKFWTGGGHYITLWKYDRANDRVYANDPGSSRRTYCSTKILRTERKEFFIFYRKR